MAKATPTDRETILAFSVVRIGKRWAIELKEEEGTRIHPSRFKTKNAALKKLRESLNNILEDAALAREAMVSAMEAEQNPVRH